MSKIKKGAYRAKVLENSRISYDIYKLKLENREIARNSFAGQFVSILCEDLVLRRPFSVAGVKGDSFEIIYKVIGKGTEYLSRLQKGDFADVIGAFGNGFKTENKKSLLIGCGVGIAPINFLSDVLKEKGIPHNSILCSGSKLGLEDKFNFIITEDGSSGLKGRLDNHLELIILKTNPEKIYICGAFPAMEYANSVAEQHNIDIEVALERDFACGTGVCMGCVIQVRKNNKIVNRRICKDGPVFKGGEVIWQ